MARATSTGTYSGTAVQIRVTFAGLPTINVRAKAADAFAAIAYNSPEIATHTAHHGHNEYNEATDLGVKYTLTVPSTSPEAQLFRAAQNANDASRAAGLGLIPVSIVIVDNLGTRTMWTMPEGRLTGIPDEELGATAPELSWIFSGTAELSPLSV